MGSNESAKTGIKRIFDKSFIQKHKTKAVKAVVGALLLSGLTFNLAFAKESPEADLQEVYHVYNGTQYVGTISDEQKIEEVIATKKEEANSKYSNMSVDAGSNIKVVPEKVYTVATNDEETINKLTEMIEVEAEAQAFIVNGKPVAYVQTAEQFDKTINLLKLQYVTQEQLNALASGNVSNAPLTKDGEMRIKEVTLEEDVRMQTTSVNPSEILTAEKAFELLTTGSLEKEVYHVQQGDVLGSIAKEHGLKIKELLALNPGLTETTVLQIDQPLNVTVVKPYVNVKVVLEKFRAETIPFEKITEKNESMLKGEKTVKQEGKDGRKQVLYSITMMNGIKQSSQVLNEVVTVEPVNYVEVVGTKVIASRGTGTFAWPAVGGYVSSTVGPRWGRNHDGIDIARPSDYTIKATDNGVVTFTGWDGTYGQKVTIDHNNGYVTVYGHLSSISVSVGQTVAQGSKIGVMGNTGRSTGTHLHFEVYQNGSLVNPLSVLNR